MLSLSSNVTARIAVTVFFAFLYYFVIGTQLAVLPVFVHVHLRFSPVIAGIAISMQYVATLVSRPRAGQMSDTAGAKRTVMRGQIAGAISGAILLVAAFASHWPVASLALLLVSRLFLGAGESCVATGATLWGIGRTGPKHTAQVISWSGVATYGALAAGAPLGVWIENRYGLAILAAIVTALPFLGYAIANTVPAVAVMKGKTLAFGKLLRRVYPHGLALALSTVGFGVIASFATLYYASFHWPNAALSLTVFGLCFVATRVLFAGTIDKRGGLPVASVSLVIEVIGLLLLWRARTPHEAMFAAAITGFGFALVFPAIGVEAVKRVDAANRGSALGVYTAFLDLALGVTGPAAGVIVTHFGYSTIFLFAAMMAFAALLLTLAMFRRSTEV